MKILVVDDDAMAAEMVAAVLQELGHSVVLAEHAMQAVECLQAEPEIALIVSDMHMPLHFAGLSHPSAEHSIPA